MCLLYNNYTKESIIRGGLFIKGSVCCCRERERESESESESEREREGEGE